MKQAPCVAPTTDAAAPDSPSTTLAIHAAQTLAASAARGRELAALLDSDTPVPGVTTGPLRPEIVAIAVPTTTHGRGMKPDDYALTASWGHFGSGEAVMPGQGRAVERAYTPAERAYTPAEREALGAAPPQRHSGESRNPGPTSSPSLEENRGKADPAPSPLERPLQNAPGAQGRVRSSPSPRGEGWGEGDPVKPKITDQAAPLGDSTFDIHLNDRAYWRNVPAAVWRYKLGGYQVLKKWLSYREQTILDRPLRPEEVQHFTDTARRIGAILLLGE